MAVAQKTGSLIVTLRLTPLIALLAILLLTGCGGRSFREILGNDKPLENIEQLSAEEIYQRAQRKARINDPKAAADLYLEIERLHPYSALARDAQLLAAKQFYDIQSYDEAVNAADRFIQLHPSDERISYAYYIKALSLFDQIAETDLDQAKTLRAKEALQDLVNRFPRSKYGLDSAIKLDLVNEQLAGKEMDVARFYHKRDRLLAAANRYKIVIEKYETTSHIEEALHRLVEVYLALGLRGDASRAAEILGHNYPSSRWYAKTYRLMNGESLRSDRRKFLFF